MLACDSRPPPTSVLIINLLRKAEKVEKCVGGRRKIVEKLQPRGDKELFQFGKAVFHSVSYLISRLLISEWSIVRLCLFPPNREQIPGSRRVANDARQRNAREENGFKLIANWHSSEPAFADTSPTDSSTAIFRTSINFLISSFHVSLPVFARADSSGRETCRFLRFHSDFQPAFNANFMSQNANKY